MRTQLLAGLAAFGLLSGQAAAEPAGIRVLPGQGPGGADFFVYYQVFIVKDVLEGCRALLRPQLVWQDTSRAMDCARPASNYLLVHGFVSRDNPPEIEQELVRCAARVILASDDPEAHVGEALADFDPAKCQTDSPALS